MAVLGPVSSPLGSGLREPGIGVCNGTDRPRMSLSEPSEDKAKAKPQLTPLEFLAGLGHLEEVVLVDRPEGTQLAVRFCSARDAAAALEVSAGLLGALRPQAVEALGPAAFASLREASSSCQWRRADVVGKAVDASGPPPPPPPPSEDELAAAGQQPPPPPPSPDQEGQPETPVEKLQQPPPPPSPGPEVKGEGVGGRGGLGVVVEASRDGTASPEEAECRRTEHVARPAEDTSTVLLARSLRSQSKIRDCLRELLSAEPFRCFRLSLDNILLWFPAKLSMEHSKIRKSFKKDGRRPNAERLGRLVTPSEAEDLGTYVKAVLDTKYTLVSEISRRDWVQTVINEMVKEAKKRKKRKIDE